MDRVPAGPPHANDARRVARLAYADANERRRAAAVALASLPPEVAPSVVEEAWRALAAADEALSEAAWNVIDAHAASPDAPVRPPPTPPRRDEDSAGQ